MSKKQKIDLNDFLTSPLRDEETTSIVKNLFNRFLSEENSVQINGQIGKILDPSKAVIAAPDLDREQNALIPALYYKTGTEEDAFTFGDLINKMKTLGIDTNNLRSILAEQHFNFAPPINLDLFVNYSNYFWIGQVPNAFPLSWNRSVEPEYYSIERPSNSSILKYPVRAATTRDIKLCGKDRSREKVTVSFLTANTFSVTGDQGVLYSRTTGAAGGDTSDKTLSSSSDGITTIQIFAPGAANAVSGGYGINDSSATNFPLFSFTITNGTQPFDAGDSFTIDIEYVSGNSLISFNGTVGNKGFVSNIVGDTTLMLIDGLTINIGSSILVCAQNNPHENGVYVVSAGRWERRASANVATSLPLGSLVYVLGGDTQIGFTFELTAREPESTFVLDDPIHGSLTFTVSSTTAPSPINDWQANNHWYHVDVLPALSATQRKYAIRATRPIIEFGRYLKLNSFVNSNGEPDDVGTRYFQRKHRFNQIPQFDLYRHDGTHTNKTSGIFFFVEDTNFPIDKILKRRVALTSSNDFIVGIGITDEEERLLYFKNEVSNKLETIWAPGAKIAKIDPVKFVSMSEQQITAALELETSGTLTTEDLQELIIELGIIDAAKGTLITSALSDEADSQEFFLEALSATTFSIRGTRAGQLADITIDVLTDIGDLSVEVISGTQPFEVGDKFSFSIRAPAAPRYVMKNPEGQIINFPGGPAADSGKIGTWLVPRRMFENMPRELDTIFNFGNLIDHSRTIIKAQDGFIGSSFSRNNYRNTPRNAGRGGLIREYGGNFPLLSSALIQKNISPLSMLDFAEKQYVSALSSVDQFLSSELAFFINANPTVLMALTSINSTDSGVEALLEFFEFLRGENTNLREVFGDSTAKVKNWPITLPMMGLLAPVFPHVTFNLELGINVIVHHDGHLSPITTTNTQFDTSFVQTVVTRSDGTKSGGVFALTAPTAPFAQQLWMNTATNEIKLFDVVADTVVPPTGSVGAFWFKRDTLELKQWSVVNNVWEASTDALSTRWKTIDTQAIRNSLMLAIEKKLFASVHQTTQLKFNLNKYAAFANIELAKYSAKYNYDTFAPDYVASNAFSWNYSSAITPGAAAAHARWFDIYTDYFGNFPGSLPTSRPDIEPWKLVGEATEPAYWSSLPDVWAYIESVQPGIKTCVDPLTGNLLPPYVSAGSANGTRALTNVMPANKDAGYTFGQNGPVETIWKKSTEYGYCLARVYFEKEPMLFLDKTWGYTYMTANNNSIRVERNLCRPLPASKFLLHGEKLHLDVKRVIDNNVSFSSIAQNAEIKIVVANVEDNATFFDIFVNGVLVGFANFAEQAIINLPDITALKIDDLGLPFNLGDEIIISSVNGIVATKFTASNSQKFLGLGQLFTNLLRYNYIDTDVSESINAYRGWTVKLVHRIGALIRGDSLSIDAASIKNLSPTAYSILLKKSECVESKWISGLRIQLVKAGARQTSENGFQIPVGDGSDWEFRVETYNSQYPQLEYYPLNTTGGFRTFNALKKQNSKQTWKRFTDKGPLTSTTMPLVLTGIQNVVSFIFGYIDRLTEEGWTVNAGERIITDELTGRNLDWQLEIEKFVDRVYTQMIPGTAHILNPFMNGLWLKTPKGLMSTFTQHNFIDADSVQAAYDVVGDAIPVKDLLVIRTDEATVVYPDTPIFSAHVFLDEYEHIIMFNSTVNGKKNITSIFNPFLGLKIGSATMTYTRQDDMDRKPRLDGFVLSGNNVTRNIVSSVDAIAGYYDAAKTFNEPTTAKHALALLGFNKKEYFNDIGASDSTQFNFWRGLIQAKGTNMTIDAFTNYKKFNSARVDEHWAYKIAEYGDNRTRTFPEVKINVQDSLQFFTQLQFFDATDTTYAPLPLFTQIEQDDDTRWFGIDDLGKGLSFSAQAIAVSLGSLAVGYYALKDIFHNGDTAAPKIFCKKTVLDISGNIVSVTMIPATTAKIVNASLVCVTDLLVEPPLTQFEYIVTGFTWRDPTKLSPVKLFDHKNSVLVKEIGLWHPAIGIHAYEPLDLVHSLTSIDPALYNYSAQKSFNPNYVTTKPWGKREVGRVWWNTKNLGYTPYYDATIVADRNERNARWGALAEWASIDLYEWVESDVPPNEYDAKAREEEGRSDIDIQVRASGQAALKTFYERNRIISIRPVAWSHSDAAVHPAFEQTSKRLRVAGATAFIESGRAADSGLTVNKHLGQWDADLPTSEGIITDRLVWNIGTPNDIFTPSLTVASPLLDASIKTIVDGKLGARLGTINIESSTVNSLQCIRMSDAFGRFQDVQVDDWSAGAIDKMEIDFSEFGIGINVERDAGIPILAASLVALLVDGWAPVYIREGVIFTPIIDFQESVLINDINDPDTAIFGSGWRVWPIPSQEQLDSDLLSPHNSWQPYLGKQVSIAPSAAAIAAMKKDGRTLKNGIAINSYNTKWSDWSPLREVRIEKISTGLVAVDFNKATFTQFATEEIDLTRVSIYADGILVSPRNYVVQGENVLETIQLVNTFKEGTKILLIYRSYQPSKSEISFNSSLKDDFSVQIEYKTDYQYTKIETRNDVGTFVGAKYYFWAENTTTVKPNKSMSIAQAKNILTNGPSQFLTFAKLNPVIEAFDSCVIAGLNSLVSNNDTYKLRFQNNETLRLDPEQLSLKNVHAEWVLIRRSQGAKIPAKLWNLITDAVAGQDANGNQLPSNVRQDYDQRHGTNYRFGFGVGQIFADTNLIRASIANTILNTSLLISIDGDIIPDVISALDFAKSDEWFATAESSRATMGTIWNSARAKQINEIFFEVLEDALANNYEFSDIFKTSYISVHSSSIIEAQIEGELEDGKF